MCPLSVIGTVVYDLLVRIHERVYYQLFTPLPNTSQYLLLVMRICCSCC